MTDKQRRFVEEYTVDFNATQAAVRAGYSAKTARQIGYQLLHQTSPSAQEVQEAIRRRLDELTMSADEALLRLTQWGRGSLRPFLDATGTLDLESEGAQANLGLLKKVKQTTTRTETAEITRTEIEIHDPKDAVVQIAKIRGLYKERRTNLNVDLASLSEEELERIAGGEDPAEVMRDRGRAGGERP